jgi:peptide/nickel transport system permease protein
LQLGYLLGGSILIETVFSWPGTGFLLNAAIFQRDLPLLQGTILVLALFFVAPQPASSTSSRPPSIRACRGA